MKEVPPTGLLPPQHWWAPDDVHRHAHLDETQISPNALKLVVNIVFGSNETLIRQPIFIRQEPARLNIRSVLTKRTEHIKSDNNMMVILNVKFEHERKTLRGDSVDTPARGDCSLGPSVVHEVLEREAKYFTGRISESTASEIGELISGDDSVLCVGEPWERDGVGTGMVETPQMSQTRQQFLRRGTSQSSDNQNEQRIVAIFGFSSSTMLSAALHTTDLSNNTR